MMKELNQKYLHFLFYKKDMITQLQLIHIILFIMNIIDTIFLTLNLYFSSSYYLEFIASLPGLTYSFWIHYLFKKAKDDDFKGKINHDAIIYIRFGYIWTIFTIVLQFSTGIDNVYSKLDGLFLHIDLFLIACNIPLISALTYYFDENKEERNIRHEYIRQNPNETDINHIHIKNLRFHQEDSSLDKKAYSL